MFFFFFNINGTVKFDLLKIFMGIQSYLQNNRIRWVTSICHIHLVIFSFTIIVSRPLALYGMKSFSSHNFILLIK